MTQEAANAHIKGFGRSYFEAILNHNRTARYKPWPEFLFHHRCWLTSWVPTAVYFIALKHIQLNHCTSKDAYGPGYTCVSWLHIALHSHLELILQSKHLRSFPNQTLILLFLLFLKLCTNLSNTITNASLLSCSVLCDKKNFWHLQDKCIFVLFIL